MKKLHIESLEHACNNPEKEQVITDFTFTFIDKEKLTFGCPVTDCTTEMNKTGACDPKVIIVWTGTDKYGKGLISAANKLTKFKNYGIKSIFESLKELNTNNNEDPDTPEDYNEETVESEVLDRITDPSAIINEEKEFEQKLEALKQDEVAEELNLDLSLTDAMNEQVNQKHLDAGVNDLVAQDISKNRDESDGQINNFLKIQKENVGNKQITNNELDTPDLANQAIINKTADVIDPNAKVIDNTAELTNQAIVNKTAEIVNPSAELINNTVDPSKQNPELINNTAEVIDHTKKAIQNTPQLAENVVNVTDGNPEVIANTQQKKPVGEVIESENQELIDNQINANQPTPIDNTNKPINQDRGIDRHK